MQARKERRMSYWDEDAEFLRELAAEVPHHRRRLLDIAHDLDREAPDGPWVEELAASIERWANEGVIATREYAERIGESLRTLALTLKRHPKP